MTDQDNREKLWDLIKDIRFCMFTTHHANGHLHSRPMTTQGSHRDEDSNLWFFMSKNSDTVADFSQDSSVNIAYADPDKDAYVSISGRAMVVDDLAKKKELWSKMTEAWFPDGPEDPALALVRVQMTHADYWDVKDSKLVQLFKMGAAALTGNPPDMQEHGRVRM